MTRTKRGSKPIGYEYWSARPGNKHGQAPGKDAKRKTKRAERRIAKAEIRENDNE